MEFSFGQEQESMRALAGTILAARANDQSLRGFTGAGDWIDRALWNDLAEAHLLGLAIPEEFGGTGLGLLDLCILFEEQGRCLAPLPLLQTLALAALPIAEFGRLEQRREILPRIAGGELIATAALCESGSIDAARPRSEARLESDTWVLNGEKECVAGGHLAGLILVPMRTPQGAAVFLLDPRTPGVSLQRQDTVNYEPQCHMVLADVRVDGGAVLGAPGRGFEIIRWLEPRAQVGLSALQVGVCEEALRRTAAYTAEREQFGRPIGSFQGVSLRAADAYIAIEAMRSTMWQAAWRIDAGLSAEEAAVVAKWWATRGGHEVVHTTQHLHGGMGADVDYPIHRFFLWAKQIGLSLGGEARQLQRLGDLIAARAAQAERPS
jgi:alkylation response protein AidB-like acyl-CoA dehydrogenase